MFTYTRKRPDTEELETIEVPLEIEAAGPEAIEAFVAADAAGRVAQLSAARAALAPSDPSPPAPGPTTGGRRKRESAPSSTE
jgi:hypothetical protein